MRAKGHDGCRASSADTANGIALLLGVGIVVAAGFCGIVRVAAIGIGFAALVLFLVKQLAEFGIPIDAVRNILLRRGLFRTGSGGCGAVLFVGAATPCRLRWKRRMSYFPCFPTIRCSAIVRRCHRHHSAVAAVDRDVTISRLVPARLP